MSTGTQTKVFPGQHEGEIVELVFRRYPIVLRKTILLGLMIILIGILPLWRWPLSNWTLKTALIVAILVLAYWLHAVVCWYYSIFIVTNQRIIEVQQKGFFNRKVREFGLDKIQNVNYHIKGIQATLFNFGNINVQTYVGDMVMDTIHRPVQTHQKIIEVVHRVKPSTPANN